jgi:hypothetical protein
MDLGCRVSRNRAIKVPASGTICRLLPASEFQLQIRDFVGSTDFLL